MTHTRHPNPRRGRSVAALLVTAAAAVAGLAAPASAQDPAPVEEPTTTTTAPPSSTTTTIPGTTKPPTTTTPASTTTTTIPDPIDDTIEVPDEVPHGELEVDTRPPAAGPWDDAAAINPALSNLVAKRSAAADRLAALEKAAADADTAAATATAERERLEGDRSDAVAAYRDSTERFRARIAAMYVTAGDIDIDLRPRVNISESSDRSIVAGAISEADNATVEEHLAARRRIEGALADAIEAETNTQAAAKVAHEAVAEAEAALEAAEEKLSATPSEIAGFVFPVAGRTSFISSFGYCRDGCRRSHQGNDLFAMRGTPVVAVEDGWVERVGTNRLGGLIVWTRGRSGYRYYYAHLHSVADITAGQEIAAGTVLGTVGDSGNARGTPPHLHFEIHPPAGGGAIDPYPILVRAPRVTLVDPDTGETYGPDTGDEPDTA